MAKIVSRVADSIKKTSKTEGLVKGHNRDYHGIGFGALSHLLDLSYSEIEAKNLDFKKHRLAGVTSGEVRDEILEYLKFEEGIKAVTVCFTDLEGRLHMLDYDKDYVVESESNLTFDGSSIKGFTEQCESDLRLKIDWTSFRWVPSDIFGAGKVLAFANVCGRDGTFYISDFRSNLYRLCRQLKDEKGIVVNAAPEIEGLLFKGVKAEQSFDEKIGFELATMSGYFSSLPHDILRIFIDKFAEAKRGLGFQNEKDHPEVAPSQFELNYKYTVALDSADQVQLYKLLARQVANSMGLTASFLPKPVANLNGNGMHINISLEKDGKNMFYDKNNENYMSQTAKNFITGVLYYASDICLALNSSVNSYRRLDPKYEAPNEIKVSAIDRGAMIRIPVGNEKSARIEVRSVAPDGNPYLSLYTLICAGFRGMEASEDVLKKMENSVYNGKTKKLPDDIYTALEKFTNSKFIDEILGGENLDKYIYLKKMSANRCPRVMGNRVKAGEILYHHEVTNQKIWGEF